MGNFNKMEVWKESRDLAVEIYQITNQGLLSKDYSFRDQIRRAAISIPSNLAEGEESLFEKVSIKFFGIVSASLAELRTQIDIAGRIGYLEQETFENLSASMTRLSRRINKLIQYRYNQLSKP
jgi:four helix bundle protein